MRYRTKYPLSIKSDRVEAGVEVELSEEDFKQFDRNDFEVVGPAVPEAAPEPEVPVKEMTLAQLRAKAKEMGLSESGSKADLTERITLAGEED